MPVIFCFKSSFTTSASIVSFQNPETLVLFFTVITFEFRFGAGVGCSDTLARFVSLSSLYLLVRLRSLFSSELFSLVRSLYCSCCFAWHIAESRFCLILGNSVLPDEISQEKCPAGQEYLSHPRKMCPAHYPAKKFSYNVSQAHRALISVYIKHKAIYSFINVKNDVGVVKNNVK